MGGSDCELIRGGWFAQPANAWSSGAYLVAAAYVLGRRRQLPTSSLAVAAAVALGLVGFGSVAYHGPQPSWAQAAHDVSITALLVALLVHGLVDGFGLEVRRGAAAIAGVVLAAAIGLVVTVRSSVLLVHGLLAACLAVVEVRRRRQRASSDVASRVATGALAFGAVLFVLGRTGGALCSPRSVLQAHAGWHVLTAVAVAALLVQDSTDRAARRRTS